MIDAGLKLKNPLPRSETAGQGMKGRRISGDIAVLFPALAVFDYLESGAQTMYPGIVFFQESTAGTTRTEKEKVPVSGQGTFAL